MRIWKKTAAAAALALAVAMLGGCTLAQFDQPEQVAQQDQESNQLNQAAAPVAAQELQGEDLTLEEELTAPSGAVVATYRVNLPQFQTETKPAFSNINDYFKTEFSAYQTDCSSLFAIVQQGYGAGWDTAATPEHVQQTAISYTLEETDTQYVSVLRTYEMTNSAGQHTVQYSGDVFLSENGWRLSFADLFGADQDACLKLLREKLAAWCTANEVDAANLEQLGYGDLTGEFALTGDKLLICLKPFALSSTDSQGQVIELNLSDFAELRTK